MQGGKVKEFLKTRKVREFCCVKSIFSQSEHPNSENFLGAHALRPPRHTWVFNCSLEKSERSQGISSFLENEHPDHFRSLFESLETSESEPSTFCVMNISNKPQEAVII